MSYQKKLRFDKKFPRYWKEMHSKYSNIKSGGDIEAHAIKTGDRLTYKRVCQFNETDLCVWEISANLFEDRKSQLRLGFAYDSFGDIGIYVANYHERYKKKEIALLGVVVKIERDYVPTGDELKAEPEKAIENTDEKTITCTSCRKSQTGSLGFLKGMGWRLREGHELCLQCDLY